MRNEIPVEKIRELLPHGKNCFLYLPDHIKRVRLDTTAGNHLTMDASFYPPKKHFEGHFPENPVYPGVIQLEALMQLGAILILTSVDESKIIYPIGIEKVRFRKVVTPDIPSVLLHVELVHLGKRGGKSFGVIYIDNENLATEAIFSFLFKP